MSIIFLVLSLFFLRVVFLLYEYIVNETNPTIKKLKKDVSLVYPGIWKIRIYESKIENVTKNKKIIYLMLRDKDNKYIEYNMLLYILLHELSHILCHEYGHTKKFYEINKNLLEKAQACKIYKPKLPMRERACRLNEMIPN